MKMKMNQMLSKITRANSGKPETLRFFNLKIETWNTYWNRNKCYNHNRNMNSGLLRQIGGNDLSKTGELGDVILNKISFAID